MYCRSCLADEDAADARMTMSRRPSHPPRQVSLASIPSQKFCIECGNDLPPGVKFCIQCGCSTRPTILTTTAAAPPEPEQAKANPVSVMSPEAASVPPSVVTKQEQETPPNPLEEENRKLKEELERVKKELQQAKAKKTEAMGVQMKDDPKYAKFFKLLDMGMPIEQVKLKVQQEGLDPSVLDKPTAAVASKTVKDDPEYAKYFKLMKMGMPAEQIKLKMSASGLKPELLDTPDAPFGDQGIINTTTTVKDDPKYEKYFKLLKMGMPSEQVKVKMISDGLDPNVLDHPDQPSTGSSPAAPPSSSLGLPPPIAAVETKNKPKPREEEKKEQEEVTLPKKPVIKPKVEMRSLFWTRVPMNVVSQTIWNDLSDQSVELNKSEIEWMFRKRTDSQASNPRASLRKGSISMKELPKSVLLLDPKRQQNVGIAIARFRMPVTEIKAAILELDSKKLSADKVHSLITMAPTVEEIDMLKNYDGDVKQLGNVEKFFLEMLTIPRYTQRIKCFRFKMQFETRMLETQGQMDTISAAIDQINDSVKIKKLLEVILAIGNYMNGSTPRGGAYGFKLDALTKLHTIKSTDQRVNLLHFIVRHLEDHQPELLAFPGELRHVTDAKRISLRQLKADVASYVSELTMLQGQVRASENSKIPEDRFYSVMNPFATDAADIIDELKRDLSNLDTSFTEVVTCFGEDIRKVGTEEFFTLISDFVEQFKSSYRQNQTETYKSIWESNKTALEEAEETEKAKVATCEHVTGDAAKTLYAEILALISSKTDATMSVETFKQMSRKYGAGELTADQLCNSIGKAFGARIVTRIIPNMAKLLPDAAKRNELLRAHEQLVAVIQKDREERRLKREQEAAEAVSRAEEKELQENEIQKKKAKVAAQRIGKLKLDDIKPVEGEEAQQLHKTILESVQQEFDGDSVRVKEFTNNARRFGNQQMSSTDFYQYLTKSFDADFVARLVPELARLLQDAEKRHALLKALCESAPGWARFAGL